MLYLKIPDFNIDLCVMQIHIGNINVLFNQAHFIENKHVKQIHKWYLTLTLLSKRYSEGLMDGKNTSDELMC